jgi:hypothetical protein
MFGFIRRRSARSRQLRLLAECRTLANQQVTQLTATPISPQVDTTPIRKGLGEMLEELDLCEQLLEKVDRLEPSEVEGLMKIRTRLIAQRGTVKSLRRVTPPATPRPA